MSTSFVLCTDCLHFRPGSFASANVFHVFSPCGARALADFCERRFIADGAVSFISVITFCSANTYAHAEQIPFEIVKST